MKRMTKLMRSDRLAQHGLVQLLREGDDFVQMYTTEPEWLSRRLGEMTMTNSLFDRADIAAQRVMEHSANTDECVLQLKDYKVRKECLEGGAGENGCLDSDCDMKDSK